MVSRFDFGRRSENETDEERKERKSKGAIYGSLERKLERNEPLTGKTLELALDLVTPDPQAEGSVFKDQLNCIAKKLKLGQPLEGHEISIILDVLLVHERLGS